MDNSKNKYQGGQVWQYKTRAGEENSYLVILKIEEYPKVESVIHVAIEQINMIGAKSGENFGHRVGHMPFSSAALDKSVVSVNKELQKLPDFAEGYTHWKEQFENGRAGIFSISVAEAVGFIESTLDQ